MHVDKAKYFKPKVPQRSHHLFHTLCPFPKLKLSKQIQVLKIPLSEEIFLNTSTNMQTKASFRNTSHKTYRAWHTFAVENISIVSTLVSAQTLPPLQLQAELDDHSTFLIHKYISDFQDIYRNYSLLNRLLLYKPCISQLRSSVLFVCMLVPAEAVGNGTHIQKYYF